MVKEESSILIIIASSLGGLIVIIILFGVIVKYQKKKKQKDKITLNQEDVPQSSKNILTETNISAVSEYNWNIE